MSRRTVLFGIQLEHEDTHLIDLRVPEVLGIGNLRYYAFADGGAVSDLTGGRSAAALPVAHKKGAGSLRPLLIPLLG
jgi:hypothetical protein